MMSGMPSQPMPSQPMPSQPAPATAGRLPPSARVLVVDDSRDNADMLALILSTAGAQTQCAYRGADGIARFRSWRPEVALVDIGLPDVSGYEVARTIRAEEHGRDVLLLAVTGFVDDGSMERIRAAGFDERLTKPVDIAGLQALILRYLGGGSAEGRRDRDGR
jgi:CheY-like chemotaxis protein